MGSGGYGMGPGMMGSGFGGNMMGSGLAIDKKTGTVSQLHKEYETLP